MTDLRYPPGPPAMTNFLSRIRLALDYQQDMIGMLSSHADTYGDIYQYDFGNGRQYIITHPEHIHQVLVTDAEHYHKDRDYTDPKTGLARFLGQGLLTSNGDFWRRQRRLIQPMFHARRIQNYAETMVAYTQREIDAWRDGDELDVDEVMIRLTLAIVTKTLFDADLSGAAERIGWAVTVLQDMNSNLQTFLPAWLPTPARLRESRAVADLDEIVYGLINQRRASGEDTGDLLSMLLALRDDEGGGMTDRQVRDEAVTIILAGHETTANALNWTWYLLAQHPAVEAKLHAELDQVLGSRPPTFSDLPNLPYTEMVVKESMRLYPPAYAFSRVAIDDITLGEYAMPKGTIVAVISYLTHRDPRWWDNPDQFQPERFTEEREKQLPRYAYLPFGGGPRVCIGNSFAMMEARLLLATMAQRYRLRLHPGQQVGLDPRITLRPKGGLRMRVEARRRPVASPVPVDGIAEDSDPSLSDRLAAGYATMSES